MIKEKVKISKLLSLKNLYLYSTQGKVVILEIREVQHGTVNVQYVFTLISILPGARAYTQKALSVS